MRSSSVRAVAFVTLSVLLAGCVGGQESTKNEKNSFHYSLQGGASGLDKTWNWETDGGTIDVKFTLQGGAGNAQLAITDASGKSVYAHTISGGGQPSDSSSVSSARGGTWKIHLKADGVGGQLDVEVKKSMTGGYKAPWP